MAAEGKYVAALLSALIRPAGEVSRWLESGDGPPPVDLALMSSLLGRTAGRLAALAEVERGSRD
jgi:hypothetical protein